MIALAFDRKLRHYCRRIDGKHDYSTTGVYHREDVHELNVARPLQVCKEMDIFTMLAIKSTQINFTLTLDLELLAWAKILVADQ